MHEPMQHAACEAPQEHSTKEKVKSLGRETKAKTKSLLHITQHSHEKDDDNDNDNDINDPYHTIRDDPAFDPSQLVAQKASLPSRIADGFSTGLKAIASPRTAAKRKAASKVAVKDRPYLSREADMEFLDAHDSLSKKRTSASYSGESDNHKAVDEQRERVEKIESLRESRRVAWTTSRHFRRALVFPTREFPTPNKDDFYVVDRETGQYRLDWTAWLRARNHNALKSFAVNRMGNVDFAGQPPFDRDVSSRFMERILIASSPWQAWFLSLRSLYRWEDPAKTKRWFAIWFIVWYMDYVITFILAYTAFMVLRNRFRHKEVEEMRESYGRALDRGSAAFKFNEIIQAHGADKWLDPMVESVGPVVQMQLSDVADTLEALNNFHDWRCPQLTWATLFWFLCAIAIGALTPTAYSMKIVTMCCIGSFFLSRPVASAHPEYRHVVNAFNWIFWGFPNDADWSMMYLRKKAQETRADLIAMKVQEEHVDKRGRRPDSAYASLDDMFSDSDDDDSASFYSVESSTSILGGLDIMSFRSTIRGIPGRLIIFSDGLRFQPTSLVASLRTEDWRRQWTELVEIQKIDPKAAMISTEGLRIIFSNGTDIKLEHVHQRDKAFNCILGFSGLRFQIVQPAAQPHSTSVFHM